MSAPAVTAVLHVGSWSSRCGACGKSCNPNSLTHDVLLGYGPDNGKPGCGATFTAVMSDYSERASTDRVRQMRPDLLFVGYEEQS